MPALGLLLVNMFGAIATWLVALFSKRFLIAAATIAIFLTIFGTFLSLLNSSLATLDVANIPPFLLTGFEMLPANTDNCLSLIIATKITDMLFDYQLRILDYRRGA